MNQFSEQRILLEQTGRLCIETEIQIAWSYLRFAEVMMKLEDPDVATKFLDTAIVGYKTVVMELTNTVVEFDERSELLESARKLFDGIVAAELHILSRL